MGKNADPLQRQCVKLLINIWNTNLVLKGRGLSSEIVKIYWFYCYKQEAQGSWRFAWTEDPVHKNVLKSFK